MRARRVSITRQNRLDQDLRALYRTGHFETVEIKLEKLDATTSNLRNPFRQTPQPKRPSEMNPAGRDRPFLTGVIN